MGNRYDTTIGYSPLEDVNREKMLQVVRVNLRIIREHYSLRAGDRALVAGAGLGEEAALIHQELAIRTFGVDLNIAWRRGQAGFPGLFLQKQDLLSLGFPPDAFDVIYCYHVLEHVPDYMAALKELRRVLRPGGVLFIGFPNKNRLLSYVGTSQNASILDKVRWNLSDYAWRLKGKFENKYGAHAGFTEAGFLADATRLFDVVLPVRNRYMELKYARFSEMVNLLVRTGLADIVFPSNYYICSKRAGGE